jgi:hypothetical protein
LRCFQEFLELLVALLSFSKHVLSTFKTSNLQVNLSQNLLNSLVHF